jgi:hypothetical protein
MFISNVLSFLLGLWIGKKIYDRPFNVPYVPFI